MVLGEGRYGFVYKVNIIEFALFDFYLGELRRTMHCC